MSDFAGMDIRVLFEEELSTHWVSNGAANALLTMAVVRNWARSNLPINRIIYLYENQPWERAVCWEARRSLPGAVLVGYRNTLAPRLLLNFYLAPGEAKEAPLPDRVITDGNLTAELLSADGYEPDFVRVAGALQMQDLLDLRPPPGRPSASETEATVLVAFSGGLEETAALAHMAVQLFDEAEGVQVVFKFHPSMPFEKVSRLLGDRFPAHVRVSEEPITELILKSSVMVYTESTVCVQALALGLPVIHLRTQFEFDMDPLEAVPDARLVATGLEELRQKVRWLLAHREEYIAEHQEEWKHQVQEMYGPVTEESFRAFVE